MKTNNKLEEAKIVLTSVATLLQSMATVFDNPETSEPNSAPVQNADKSKEAMWNLLHDAKASIKGLHHVMSCMADDMYAHMDASKHLPPMKNWDHMDYACKQLGFHKEQAIRNAAYANTKVTIG